MTGWRVGHAGRRGGRYKTPASQRQPDGPQHEGSRNCARQHGEHPPAATRRIGEHRLCGRGRIATPEVAYAHSACSRHASTANSRRTPTAEEFPHPNHQRVAYPGPGSQKRTEIAGVSDQTSGRVGWLPPSSSRSFRVQKSCRG
jgi:hypothetical protein